ncbi:D-inositol 3-phosphate glycosyltransferase [Candidatus Thermoflexus japonica]|uniref:D-inositol 3-phosphate glycosyltransferase n=1 Tax=Candidatus Thermoflexus japonica TaxID=2035417 RepID=A0A2H5Y5A9_9CHLR|nr:D-inositol 3-phosphate glycosyltransferase [Candidatus Thermoflexus japonica]
MTPVVVDVSPAVHHRAGLGRYAAELVKALVPLLPGGLAIFYHDAGRADLFPPLDALPARPCSLPAKPWRLQVMLADLFRRPMDACIGPARLFHATDHLLPPFRALPSVFTLHDLIFRLYPETHMPLNRWFLTLMMPRFLRRADAIIAVSECTRRDAVRWYRIPEDRIHVIYEGVGARFRPAPPEALAAIRARYFLPDRFILYVGTIEPRKNLPTLFAAYRMLLERWPDLGLVVAGRPGWLTKGTFRALRDLGLEGRVRFLGYVPDEDLPALYSAAAVFAFPSRYEGFGLPPLEAMACGTPVVVSDTSSLPEIVGEAGLRVPPDRPADWVAALAAVLSDASLRAHLRGMGLRQAARFRWSETAERTVAVYERVLRSRGVAGVIRERGAMDP